MEHNNNNNQSSGTNNEEIMNRVNQTFEKITQDVKEMIHNNDQSENNQLS